MKGKRILIISPEKWGNNHVSKHHYALSLAEENTVFFLNPPTGSVKVPLLSEGVIQTIVSENLSTLDIKNLLPKLDHLPKKTQEGVYRKQAKAIQQKTSIENFDIVWSFDPHRYWDLRTFKAKKYIYHAVDDHKAKHEAQIAESADLVLLVSEFLRPKFNSAINPQHISHGFFGQIENYQDDYAKVKIAWMGNLLSENLDLKLLLDIAQAYPEKIELTLIGPRKENNLGGATNAENQAHLKALEQESNVVFTGALHDEQLREKLGTQDILLSIYKDHKRNISPYKLLQYLATGKLVISSYLFDFDSYPEKAIIMAQDSKDFLKRLNSVISELDDWNSIECQQMRKAYVASNSYQHKISEIETLLK